MKKAVRHKVIRHLPLFCSVGERRGRQRYTNGSAVSLTPTLISRFGMGPGMAIVPSISTRRGILLYTPSPSSHTSLIRHVGNQHELPQRGIQDTKNLTD